MVHAGRVFVAGIHLSRTWMSGSFESMRWNACVHRLDLGLYSHPKELWGSGVRTQDDSKRKITFTGKILRGGSSLRCCIKQDSQPHTLPTSYSSPQQDLSILFLVMSRDRSFSNGGGQGAGFKVMQVIKLGRHLSFSCHLSTRIKIVFVKHWPQ